MSAAPTNSERTDLDAAIGSIDRLLDELADLAEEAISPERFYQQLLDRAVLAVDAKAAAVWSAGPGEQLVLASHSQANSIYPNSQHARYRRDRDILSELGPQGSRDGILIGQEHGTPMACCSISMQGRSAGVLVLYCDPDLNDAALRIHQQFVAALAELAQDYEKSHRAQNVDLEIQRWRSLNACAVAAYRSLNPKKTAFELANEGRVYLQCDRVSVFRSSGRGMKIMASSGLASLDTRSEMVRRMSGLASRVAQTKEPFFFKEGTVDVPRRIAKPLRAYLKESKASQVAVIPLLASRPHQPGDRQKVIGTVVIEILSDIDTSDLLERCQLFAIHATSAMARAVQYQSIPLRPVWSVLGWVLAQFGLRRIPRTLFVLAAITAIVIPLMVVEADFVVEARGELRPSSQRNVFAPMDGYVSDISVEHGKMISQGATVAQLQSPELDRELKTINGRLLVISKKISGLAVAINQADPNNAESQLLQAQFSAEIEELKQEEINLKQQRELVVEEIADLEIKSPITGQVVTWQVERDLSTRPVRRGESLLKIADVKGDWLLELQVPDRKIGYVSNAVDESEKPVAIRFVLETDPDQVADAKLSRIASSATARSGEPAHVLVTASFDKETVSQLRPGSTVVARIHCGRRSLGYVWLHDMVDAVERKLFW